MESCVGCQIGWVGRSVSAKDQVALRVWSPVTHASKTIPVVNVGVVFHGITASKYCKCSVCARIVFLQKIHTHIENN